MEALSSFSAIDDIELNIEERSWDTKSLRVLSSDFMETKVQACV